MNDTLTVPGRPVRGALDALLRQKIAAPVAMALLAPLALASCGPRRPHRAVLVNQPAAGRPATCPEGAVDPLGDGTASPMDARCSYADAAGGAVVELRGHVRAEGEQLVPLALGEVPVRVMQLDARNPTSSGKEVAAATTDAQGGFSIGVLLPPGSYAVVVGDVQRPVARRGFEVGGDERVVDGLDVVVPESAAADAAR